MARIAYSSFCETFSTETASSDHPG
jgi:hypothetical protein